MDRRYIITGLIIFSVLVGITYWRNSEPLLSDNINSQLEEQFENAFNINIPDNVEKVELKDVTGGNTTGIATRNFENGQFTHAVLADLPDPAKGEFYEGWLTKGQDKDLKYVSTGRLRIAKGGWLLDFISAVDYSDYNTVVVTLEKIADDTPELHLLEGFFN